MNADGYPTIKSPRLLLRPWRDEDLPALAAINADPRVMEHFPAPLTREQSDARARRIREHFDRHGFGKWVVEAPGTVGVIGEVGFAVATFDAHFTPCVEIGWRFAAEFWGRGYATEAASAALAFGFETLGLDEIVAFTVPANVRSWRVMERLGMTRNPDDDFDHPEVPKDHPLARCVLYRMPRSSWTSRR